MTSSFHDTRWTLVSRSRGSDTQAKAALSELCEAYYAPVVTFLRREGRAEDVARELAHDFFVRLLQGDAITGADPQRGRFRSYLLSALKRVAADQRDRDHALKRGGGQRHAVIENDGSSTDASLQIADKNAEAPDVAFDRQWALTVLARAMSTLEAELRGSGKGLQFDTLKSWLTADGDAIPQDEAATKLGLNPNTVRVAIHRLRKRFRDAVKAEISQTVSELGNVREELDALMAALRK